MVTVGQLPSKLHTIYFGEFMYINLLHRWVAVSSTCRQQVAKYVFVAPAYHVWLVLFLLTNTFEVWGDSKCPDTIICIYKIYIHPATLGEIVAHPYIYIHVFLNEVDRSCIAGRSEWWKWVHAHISLLLLQPRAARWEWERNTWVTEEISKGFNSHERCFFSRKKCLDMCWFKTVRNPKRWRGTTLQG